MTFKDIIATLQKDGWLIKDQKGSHVHLVHPKKKGKITIPKQGKKDIKPGTLNAIWRQAELK